MTNLEKINKEIIEEIINKYSDPYDYDDPKSERFMDLRGGTIEGLKEELVQALTSQQKEFRKMVEEVEHKKFPQGERKWCIECVKRIKKHILKQLK